MDDRRYALARSARAMAMTRGSEVSARHFLAAQYGVHNAGGELLARAVSDSTALLPGGEVARDLGAHLIALIERRSIIGRLSAVSGFRRVPMFAPILAESAGAVATWVAEGEVILTSGPAFEISRLKPRKVSTIVPYTDEFLRLVGDTADAIVNRDVSRALAVGEDRAFLDPANLGSEAIPASPFAGNVTAGTGDTEADLAALIGGVPDDLIMDATLIVNARDVPHLVSLGLATAATINVAEGGLCAGMATLTCTAIERGALAVVVPQAIALADGGALIEASTQAIVQVQDSATGEMTLLSLWPSNLGTVRGLHFLNWAACRDGAARMVTGAITQTREAA